MWRPGKVEIAATRRFDVLTVLGLLVFRFDYRESGCLIFMLGLRVVCVAKKKKPDGGDAGNDEQTRRKQSRDDEIVIGLVGPIGVDLEFVSGRLKKSLRRVKYRSKVIQLSNHLVALDGFTLGESLKVDDRYHALMDLGNRLRDETGDPAIMSRLAVAGIRLERDRMIDRAKRKNKGADRRAFILRQLKRPEEVQALRQIYGDGFLLVAIHGDRQERIEKLASRIARSENDMDELNFDDRASRLVIRDEHEGTSYGQDLRETFAGADFFVDPSNRPNAEEQIDRFVDLLFGLSIRTPTKDEYAMYVAKGSAMLSGSLARQVGAAITDDSGAVLATGTNEVPKAGGGVYWEGDPNDARDHVSGEDPSDRLRHLMVSELFEILAENKWLSKSRSKSTGSELADEALYEKKILKAARVNAVIEYVRSAHAEQTALLDAARRGITIDNSNLVVTTFPCHECTRLIILAGVKRVVFVEPYPKSLGPMLYKDSIQVGLSSSELVRFEPFVGIAPDQYARLFRMDPHTKRKDATGRLLRPKPREARLRTTSTGGRVLFEDEELFAIQGLRNINS